MNASGTVGAFEPYDEVNSGDIAIVGVGARFPGCPTPQRFWDNLKQGADLTTHFSPDEIEDSFTPEQRSQKDYVAAKPVIDDVDLFDAGFFGMYAKEAALTDPQARIFLEICYHALEDAGLDPSRYPGAVGVWAGCSLSTYFLHNVLKDRATLEEFTSSYQVGCYPMFIAALTDTLATRVAYKLDLRGPAITVQTACSTSLTAIAEACQALRLGHADAALAGGVSITFPQRRGYFAQDGGMVSPDGQCRPFDARANGTVFGHGAGVVVLKRLEDALDDADQIYAVVRGCGINNDGCDKVAFTAPSVAGQAEAIRLALVDAGASASDVGYVECHGTATPLGDPIEFEGLSEAFSDQPPGACWLGSAKANIGHLDAAAGVAGVIKAAFMVRDGVVPPLTHFTAPNPAIDLDASCFTIPQALQRWSNEEQPRLAGVSSFGIGGTNVHVLIGEPPAQQCGARVSEPETDRAWLLPLSARTSDELRSMRTRLADHLDANPDAPLSDVAFTLQQGRRTFPVRSAVSAHDHAQAVAALRDPARAMRSVDAPGRLAFLFPGQGAQYPGMGAGLYRTEPEFRRWIDQGRDILSDYVGESLDRFLQADSPGVGDVAQALSNTRFTQPILFLVSFALAKLWQSRGVTPDVVVGHSVGEFAAATFAGVLSFDDAARLIATRGRLMQDMAAGAMLSVRAGADEVRPLLSDELDIAAQNSPSLTTVAGPIEAMAALERSLESSGIKAKRLHTSHAFHSAMMNPVVEPMREAAADVVFAAPTIPFISAVTGRPVSEAEPWSPASVAHHCRACVRFSDAIIRAGADGPLACVEVGPGRTLITFAGQALRRGGVSLLAPSLPDHKREQTDTQTFHQALGDVWSVGVNVNASAWPSGEGTKTSLPAYPFTRKRHFIDAPRPSWDSSETGTLATVAQHAAPASAPPSTPSSFNEFADRSSMLATPLPQFDAVVPLKAFLIDILTELSGEELNENDTQLSFLELGFDSLFLGQFAQRVGRDLDVEVTFRQLLVEMPTVGTLADAIAPRLGEAARKKLGETTPPAADHAVAGAVLNSAMQDAEPAAVRAVEPAQPTPMTFPASSLQSTSGPMGGAIPATAGMEGVVRAQIDAMQRLFADQLGALGATPMASPSPLHQHASETPCPADGSDRALTQGELAAAPAQRQQPNPVVPGTSSGADAAVAAPSEADQRRNGRFTSAGVASRAAVARTDAQDQFIADLTAAYGARCAKSKAYTQRHRKALADPRAAAGFRADWKDLVFPIVAEKAKGARIWDIDGNEYVDVVNGYGQTAFGHAPDFVMEAVAEQSANGFAIGPQALLAGEVAERIATMTGHERVTFCNTGSEAVMAAMRVARAVTGRERVVMFNNDYHGQFDEVLVKARGRSQDRTALPLAPGIPHASVKNVTILNYGDPASLEWIASNRDDLAAVIIEPVQSRHPELRPEEFVRSLRELADSAPWALVIDEVVTGFRVHPAGVQGVWGVKGDLATYGKVLGGGLPIGVLAGASHFMDALDGGHWAYGDASLPEVAPTFFAGTFVRHPLALAAARAVLTEIEQNGPALHRDTAARTAELVASLNTHMESMGCPARAETFSSWFMVNFGAHHPLGSLMYTALRMEGLHVQEGFPCYLTTAHGEREFEAIERAFKNALARVQSVGILTADGMPAAAQSAEQARTVLEPGQQIPLTPAQAEVWMAAQLSDEASCAFNESVSLRLEGTLNERALATALSEIAARHDALRTSFARDGRSFRVNPNADLDVVVVDLSDEDDPAAAMDAHLAVDAETPFDLVDGSPFRVHLLRLGARHHVLVFTAHHIVCDGWSSNVILEELGALYSAATNGTTAQLPPTEGFARYALDKAHTTNASNAAEQYWLGEFKTVPSLPELPQDRPRPSRRNYGGATTCATVDWDLTKAVKQAGARQGATLFTTLFASLQVVLSRLSGASDIVIGCPSAGQTLTDDPALVGHCVNFLPIRSPIAQGTSFGAHLKATQAKVLAAFEHQDFTYGALVQSLDVARSVNRLPLTEIQFNLERVGEGLHFDGLTASAQTNPKSRSNFDAFFNVVEQSDGLRIEVDYNTEVLDEATVQRWLSHFRTVLRALTDNPDRALHDVPLLEADEVTQLIEDTNATQRPFDRDATVLDLVRNTMAETPERIALVHRDRRVTYGELAGRVDELAGRLAAELPAHDGPVGVAVERSVDMVAALLAVWSVGRTYVPMDPNHPLDRLADVMADAGAVGLLASSDALEGLAQRAGTVCVRTDKPGNRSTARPARQPRADDPAYVIYTSGSTGKPKGVVVGHRSVVNFLHSMAREPGLTADDRLLAVTTISFDIAVLEVFLPLVVGATVVLADSQDVLDGFALISLFDREDITVCQATPTLWSMLLEAGLKPRRSLSILAGGEPLPKDLARTLSESAGALWNMYGPTETTIWSSLSRIEQGFERITIGRPIDNTALHILGEQQDLLPIGAVGDLWIGGDGLALGYHGRTDLTEAAFCDLPLPGREGTTRLYRTGDVGRRLADGSIELFGRRDSQVKLRGFRIELGDVEAALRAAPGVAKAAADVRETRAGTRQLVGYYVPVAGADPQLGEIGEAVGARVPAYMVPTALVRLDALPQTANGKLNRKALPDPAPTAAPGTREVKAPESATEKKIAAIFADVLGTETVGVDDALFAIGADSLAIFRIAARMLDAGLGLEARHLMQHPSVRELAAFADSRGDDVAQQSSAPSLKSFRRGARRKAMVDA